MSSYLVIVNPWAGRGKGKKLVDEIRTRLDTWGVDFDVKATEGPKHATELASNGAGEFDVVVAAGGDGTVNEVVNGLMSWPSSATFAVLPIGSGNDFAKMVGPSLEFDVAMETLRRGDVKPIDVGHTNGFYFANGLGIGFDAVATKVSYEVKWLRGTPIYVYSVLKTALTYKAPPMTITYNGTAEVDNYYMVAVTNGQCLGGGFWITPNAKVDDAQLDVCMIRDLSLLEVVTKMPRMMRGEHEDMEEVTMARTDRIKVTSEEALAVHTDGEVIDTDPHEIEVEVLPKALNVIGKW